jgi:hypothetical protein
VTATVVGALAAGASVAEAGYTAVKQPKRRSEAGHEQILERVYGGNFVSDASGLSFSNESGVTVTRVEDDGVARTDQTWSGRHVSARAVAAFSRKQKTAGYFGATSGGEVKKVFDVSGRRFDVAGAGESVVENDLRLGRDADAVRTFSSVASANRDGMDHLVSYEVKGLSAQQASVYLLCWEDKFSKRSDRDYNDLVVEVRAGEAASEAAMAEPLLIPLPPAAWTGLGGLLGVGVVSRMRKIRWRYGAAIG